MVNSNLKRTISGREFETPLGVSRGWLESLTNFASAHSVLLLRVSLGVVFCAFGVLKLFPGLSPADHLAGDTINWLSFGTVPPFLAVRLLAAFECTIGLLLLVGFRPRLTAIAILVHMAGTLTPLILFPHQCFQSFLIPTMLGQYILKNLVFIAAALSVLGSRA
jgi:uncharacterized membrane protein YphA (DoxX/SURF4 family)